MSLTGASAAPEDAMARATRRADEGGGDLRIIAGPTGAGKSAIALALAERHGALIVSADSRQVYRGFDIGTAKPTAAERERVAHEGVDVADPVERWSAARWAGEAERWIDDATARGQPVLVVGGTGFWLQALVRPLADEPVMDPARRIAVQSELSQLDTATLRRWVAELDPPLSGERQGRAQLLRAAEVALVSGTRLSDWHAAGASRPGRRARWLIVDPLEALHGRIEARLDAMFDGGWPEEVRGLIPRVPPDAPAWNACGYREIRAMVDGQPGITEDGTRQAVLIATRQYAKRQRTWFRNQLDGERVRRLDPRARDAGERAERWFAGTADEAGDVHPKEGGRS
jgi:tRNA dimethylallyltransferase